MNPISTMNSRGQFEPFKLVIGAIMGLLILVIVLGIVSNISEVKWELSKQRFYDGFQTALKTPTGDIVLQKKLFLKGKNDFGSIALVSNTRLKPECVTFYTNTESIKISPNRQTVNVLLDTQANVSYVCTTQALSDAVCPIRCKITFEGSTQ